MDGKTFLNLFKIVGDESPQMIFYAKILFPFTLAFPTSIYANSDISFKDGRFIWITFGGASSLDSINRLRLCQANSYYDKSTNECMPCQAQSVSLGFQSPECISCQALQTDNVYASLLKETICP
jgi:hypothetical protein